MAKEISSRQQKLLSLRVDITFESRPTGDPYEAMRILGKVELKEGDESFAFKGEMRHFASTIWPVAVAVGARPKLDANAPIWVREAQSSGGHDSEMQGSELSREELEVWARTRGESPGGRGDGPGRSTARTFNGDKYRADQGMFGVIVPASTVPPDGFQSAYCVNIGFMPQSITASSGYNETCRQFGLPGTLLNNSYSLTMEASNGDSVAKLVGRTRVAAASSGNPAEFADDTIWINVSKGYMMEKREIKRNGRLTLRFLNRDPEEIVSGVWMPRLAECHEFGGEDRTQPIVVNRMRVKSWSVNDVPDSLFTLVFPPGKHITDFSRENEGTPISYTIPVDPATLDAAIARAMQSPRSRLGWGMLFGLATIAALMLAVRWKVRIGV